MTDLKKDQRGGELRLFYNVVQRKALNYKYKEKKKNPISNQKPATNKRGVISVEHNHKLIKLLPFFLSDKCELTAGSDEKNTAQPRRGSSTNCFLSERQCGYRGQYIRIASVPTLLRQLPATQKSSTPEMIAQRRIQTGAGQETSVRIPYGLDTVKRTQRFWSSFLEMRLSPARAPQFVSKTECLFGNGHPDEVCHALIQNLRPTAKVRSLKSSSSSLKSIAL